MFDDPRFDRYEIEQFPLNQDAYLIDERYSQEYEEGYLSLFAGGPFKSIGYVSYISVRAVHQETVELAWYPNIWNRFHRVAISLPREKIRACVGSGQWSWNPSIFVESAWLDGLYSKSFSVFGLVDAINIREIIRDDKLSRTQLLDLRVRIDELAAAHPGISCISFADSILIKSNWTVGSIHNDLTYSYCPEEFIGIARDFQEIFSETIGTDSYTVLTQGYNEYYEDGLLHISRTRNHICLNSLGTPFAQLSAIDRAARDAIRNKIHAPAELYLDDSFYLSLRLEHDFEKSKRPKREYDFPAVVRPNYYFYTSIQTILDHLKTDREPAA